MEYTNSDYRSVAETKIYPWDEECQERKGDEILLISTRQRRIRIPPNRRNSSERLEMIALTDYR